MLPTTNPSVPAPSLLIVEDEFLIANDLRRILSKAGYRIVGLAASVPEAKALVETHNPTIALIDIFLDGQETGIDLAHWLAGRGVPFVFLSANLNESVLSAANVTQPFGFLSKPFREKDVLNTLDMARYRHAHGEEARLRQQQAIQMAVNDAIVSIQGRDELCQAIAGEIDRLVPIDFFNLQLGLPEQPSYYGMLLQKQPAGGFTRIHLASILPPEAQPNLTDIRARPFADQLGDRAGVFRDEALDQLCVMSVTARAWRNQAGIRSVAVFPVRLERASSTTFMLGCTDPGGLSDSQFQSINLILPQITLALSNLLARDEIEAHRQVKATELALVNAFRVGNDMPTILKQVAERLNDLFPLDVLALERPGTSVLGTPLVDVVQKENGRFTGLSQQPVLPATLSAYLTVGDQLIGKLLVGSRSPFAFTAYDQQTLDTLTPQIALALDNLLAYEQIRTLSETLEQEKIYLTEEINTTRRFGDIVGSSAALQAVFKSIAQVAPTDYTVLLMGETGTGKELLARAVHNLSSRSGRSMIKVNCAALPPQLIESELFGHERGSFTGATERRIGKFELASTGTLFLDEIGELPLELQVKLLRAIQEQEIERIGGKGPIRVDVRIIAATNRNLHDEVARGQFRPDLYYRLNVFPIQVPPLRNRRDDIMPLALHFLRRIGKQIGKPITGISALASQQLLQYHWPGNVRELEHVLERAALLSPGTTLELPEPLLPPRQPLPGAAHSEPVISPLQDTMRAAILSALAKANNRIRGQGGAAELLHVKPTTLEARMKKLNITVRRQPL
ncbi:hypothetical protein GCM10027578_37080 [Spirosoma luteolum]